MNKMADLPYAVFSRDGTSKLWVRFSIKGEGQVRYVAIDRLLP